MLQCNRKALNGHCHFTAIGVLFANSFDDPGQLIVNTRAFLAKTAKNNRGSALGVTNLLVDISSQALKIFRDGGEVDGLGGLAGGRFVDLMCIPHKLEAEFRKLSNSCGN